VGVNRATAPMAVEAAAAAAAAAAEEEARDLAAKEAAERADAEVVRTREAMEGGHLFILNSVSTELKSFCFRQDTRDLSNKSGAELLAQLERLRVLNEELKTRARQEGFDWHLGSATLLPLQPRSSAATGTHDPRLLGSDDQGKTQAARARRAAQAAARLPGSLLAAKMAKARLLARGSTLGGCADPWETLTAGTNTDAEMDEHDDDVHNGKGAFALEAVSHAGAASANGSGGGNGGGREASCSATSMKLMEAKSPKRRHRHHRSKHHRTIAPSHQQHSPSKAHGGGDAVAPVQETGPVETTKKGVTGMV